MHLKIGSATLAAALLCLGCGSSSTSTPSAVKSKLGESCTRTDDCESNLMCISQTCVQSAPQTATPGGLSKRGETCSVSSDCLSELICVPVLSGNGASGLGRCDYADYNLNPTGKTCWAECNTSADCCELPLEVHDQDTATYKSCEDIVKTLGDGASACETTSVGTTHPTLCFLYKTYCDCATSNPWTCTAGICNYTKACSINSAQQPKGCPSYSRAGRATVSTCDLKTNTCAAPAVSGCKVDTDCDNKMQVADDLSDLCSTGECVCLASLGSCYRRCRNSLECATGYTCDTSRQVCVSSGQCDTDVFCAIRLGKVTAKCVNKVCKTPCVTDQDCSGSGLGQAKGNVFNGEVCVSNYCVPLGCSSDAECATASGVKLFCQTTPAATAAETVRSAITN